MLFHLKPDVKWDGNPIPAHAIRPIMFLSRYLTKPELNYGPSELEVACLVWACKRLRTTLIGSRQKVVVLTDHESTKGIVTVSTFEENENWSRNTAVTVLNVASFETTINSRSGT